MKYYVKIALTFLALNICKSEELKQANLERGKKIAENVCVSCHGADGNAAISMYPRLAGQHVNYIYNQAKNIINEKRTWGLASAMLPMVKDFTKNSVGQELYDILYSMNIHNNFSDQDLFDVSYYYSKQIPKSGEVDPNENPSLGALIYKGGLYNKNIPACMSCHGPSGAGIPANSQTKDGIIAFPRITGQNKDYVITQLEAFQSGERGHFMMSDIANRMSKEEITAVANYIQGLK